MSKICPICKTTLEDKVKYCFECGFEQVVVPDTASEGLKEMLNRKQKICQLHYSDRLKQAETTVPCIETALNKLIDWYAHLTEDERPTVENALQIIGDYLEKFIEKLMNKLSGEERDAMNKALEVVFERGGVNKLFENFFEKVEAAVDATDKEREKHENVSWYEHDF